MWTRQHKRSFLPRLILPTITLAFLSYFGYHAYHGDNGINAKIQLEKRKAALQITLDDTVRRREALEARTALLQDGSIEKDMLDEHVRASLGMVRRDEIVVLLKEHGAN